MEVKYPCRFKKNEKNIIDKRTIDRMLQEFGKKDNCFKLTLRDMHSSPEHEYSLIVHFSNILFYARVDDLMI